MKTAKKSSILALSYSENRITVMTQALMCENYIFVYGPDCNNLKTNFSARIQNILKAMFSIQGVQRIDVSRYSLHIYMSEAFVYDRREVAKEIVTSILEYGYDSIDEAKAVETLEREDSGGSQEQFDWQYCVTNTCSALDILLAKKKEDEVP